MREQVKRGLRMLGSLPFRLVPAVVRRRLVQAVLDSLAAQEARRAMRWLLQIDDDLSVVINAVAMRYDGGVHVKHRLMRYHDFFVERISPGESVLDIGCGYGAVAYSIASRTGANVTGIDIDRDFIAMARERFRHPNLTFIEGDALVSLPEGHFDTVVLSNVLEHIERRVEFLDAIQRRVRPRRFLIRVPTFDRDWRVPCREELGMSYFSDCSHFTEYTRESFAREMTDAGLRVAHAQVNWGEIWAEVVPASADEN